MKEIKIGMKSEAETIVTKENFAVTVGSGSLEVFATPMMTALMEKQRQLPYQNAWKMTKQQLALC